MADYPYINTAGKLREFISKINNMGVPDSVSTKWLPTVGFGSTNHRPIIGIMRFIGFLSGNKPTERWISFRDATQGKHVMAKGIREGYSELFLLYNDAHDRTDEELKNFFKGKMTGGGQVIANTVATFKALCSFADFSPTDESDDRKPATNQVSQAALPIPQVASDQFAPVVPLHIDVQVHISSDASGEQIDHIFSSMSKHLFRKDPE